MINFSNFRPYEMLEVYKFKIYIAIFLVRSLLFLNIAPLLFINYGREDN